MRDTKHLEKFAKEREQREKEKIEETRENR